MSNKIRDFFPAIDKIHDFISTSNLRNSRILPTLNRQNSELFPLTKFAIYDAGIYGIRQPINKFSDFSRLDQRNSQFFRVSLTKFASFPHQIDENRDIFPTNL